MNETCQVYIYLLDEGVDVWRPVRAQPLGDGKYRIVSDNNYPEDEHWQFSTGDIVRCEEQQKTDGHKTVTCLIAVEKVEA